MIRRVAAAWLLAALAGAARAGEPVEPPPESPDGSDYEMEASDSLSADQLEVTVGAAGAAGGPPRRSRLVRFSGDSLEGAMREGRADPLAGGALEGRLRRGAFGVGRLAPRWGRGLVIGAPADPWSYQAADRGSAFRGRAGEGAWAEVGGAVRGRALLGTFGRRRLAGASLSARGAGLGVLGDGAGRMQSSLSIAARPAAAEWAIDQRGRWRAEAAAAGAAAGASWSARVRAGHARFQSLAEPRRSGPARAAALAGEQRLGAARARGHASLWRFRSGLAGARVAAALEVAAPAGRWAVGFEEQHGSRRDLERGRFPRDPGMRQGFWGEWRSPPAPLGLGLRHEAWGRRSWARDAVRVVTTVRLEARWAGCAIALAHSVHDARRGESLYLPESEADRLVLRAVSGAGERTRLEGTLPAAGGAVRAGLAFADRAAAPRATRWTVAWSRRTRVRRERGGRSDAAVDSLVRPAPRR